MYTTSGSMDTQNGHIKKGVRLPKKKLHVGKARARQRWSGTRAREFLDRINMINRIKKAWGLSPFGVWM